MLTFYVLTKHKYMSQVVVVSMLYAQLKTDHPDNRYKMRLNTCLTLVGQ